MHHDWLVKNAIVDLLIKMKGKLKHTSCNSLSPLGGLGQGYAAQTLLTEVKPCLTHRLVHLSKLSLTHEFMYLLRFKDTASLCSHERHEM